MTTPSEVKAFVASELPDNVTGAIQPINVRAAVDAAVDYASEVVPSELFPSRYLTSNEDGTSYGWETFTVAQYNSTRGKVTYLMDEEAFRTAYNAGQDVAAAVQAVIDREPNTNASAIVLYYPAGEILHGSVFTGSRQVSFIGQGWNISIIRPTPVLTRSVFNINGPYCSVVGFAINDADNSATIPGFAPNPSDTTALIKIGHSGSTGARRCYLNELYLTNSRALGVFWDGGSFLLMDRVVFNNCYSGGFMSGSAGGDTNHFKFRDVNFTRCFNFGMWLKGNNNGGGAGFAEQMKFFECQNVALRLDGNDNVMSLFVEGTNGSGEGINMTRTAGSNVMSIAELPAMSTLRVGNFISGNPAVGFPQGGLYITGIDYAARRVTVSQTAVSSGTTNYRSFGSRSNYLPSLVLGANTQQNNLHIGGDALDPDCVFDNSSARTNTVLINNSFRKFNSVNWFMPSWGGTSFDPNKEIRFQIRATTVAGSDTITLSDPSYATRVIYGASIQSDAFPNGSVVSVDPAAGTIQMSQLATQSGEFRIEVIPNGAAGYLSRFIAPNVICRQSTTQFRDIRDVTLVRGAVFMGCTTVGSNVVRFVQRWDNETDGPGTNNRVWSANSAIPEGCRVTLVEGNSTIGWTLTLDKPATETRTGVIFHLHGENNIQYVWPYIKQFTSNPRAIEGSSNWGLLYRTPTGEMRSVVDPLVDGLYQFTWNPPSLAALGFASMGAMSTDRNGKAVVNAVVGDKIEVTVTRVLNGVQIWGEVVADNSINLYAFNPTSAPIDIISSTFYVTHTRL